MTTPQPNPTDDLEAVARIIDPAGWAFYDRHIENPLMGAECRNEVQVSLSRARRIAALRPAGVGEAVSIGRNITFSPESWDVGNAVVSSEAPDGPYWTLIAQGGNGRQNAIAAEIVRRLNATPPHPDDALMERVRTVGKKLSDTWTWRQANALHGDAHKYQCACQRFDEAMDDFRALLSDLKAGAGR